MFIHTAIAFFTSISSLNAFVNYNLLSLKVNNVKIRMLSNDISTWLENKGGVSKNDLSISFSNINNQISCRAIKQIKKGETICTIPLNICLDPSNVNSIFNNKINSKMLRTGNIGLLSLLLLYEKALGPKSKYFDYINALPTSPPGILSWNEDDINELKSSTTRKISVQIEAIEDDYKLIKLSKISTLFTDTFFTYNEFKYSIGLIKSRSIVIAGRPILVPGLDFIEFDPMSMAEPVLIDKWTSKVVKVNAERDYNNNEKIVISFGLKSSAECLEDHGGYIYVYIYTYTYICIYIQHVYYIYNILDIYIY